MKSELKVICQIQEVLKEYGYFDIERISNEILAYAKETGIQIKDILKRISNYEPWEYICGKTEFYDNIFKINNSVLIPRIETEQIVDISKEFLESNLQYNCVIDVGTGSGCIIISLAKIFCYKNDFKFIGTDISLEALEIAKENSMLHNVNEKISFRKDYLLKEHFIKNNSLIIANLPYIPTDMYRNLDRSVKDFEPREALDGGKDGLKYYRELLKQLEEKNISKYSITLLIEIEPSTLEMVEKLFSQYKYNIIKDYRELNRFLLIHLS